MEPGSGWRVEAVDVVELDGVEPLPRAHGEALVEHRLERVELAQIDPALLREAEVQVAERRGGEVPAERARAGVRPVVLPGQVDVADGSRVRQSAGLPAGVDGADLSRGGKEAVDVVDVHGAGACALQRRDPADLPVPAHRMVAGIQVRRIPARPPALRPAGQGRGQRHDPPAEPRGRGAGPVGGPHLHRVPTGPQLAGIEHAAGGQRPPRPVVDPVPLHGDTLGRVVVRRVDLEVLLRRTGAGVRRAVHELGRRRPVRWVGPDRPPGQVVHRGADDLEGEGGRVGLDHLGRRVSVILSRSPVSWWPTR